MKYEIRFTSRFKKDFKLLQKRNLEITQLTNVIALLADGTALPPEYHDHLLVGDYKGCHECHIRPDWLLVYKIFEDILVLELTRTGTHSDLFG